MFKKVLFILAASVLTHTAFAQTKAIAPLHDPADINRNSEAYHIWTSFSMPRYELGPGFIFKEAILEFYQETNAGLATRKTNAAKANYLVEMLQKHNMLGKFTVYLARRAKIVEDYKKYELEARDDGMKIPLLAYWYGFVSLGSTPSAIQAIKTHVEEDMQVLETIRSQIDDGRKEVSLLLDRMGMAEIYYFVKTNENSLSKKNYEVFQLYHGMGILGIAAHKYVRENSIYLP